MYYVCQDYRDYEGSCISDVYVCQDYRDYEGSCISDHMCVRIIEIMKDRVYVMYMCVIIEIMKGRV